jgi:hypothetical protein
MFRVTQLAYVPRVSWLGKRILNDLNIDESWFLLNSRRERAGRIAQRELCGAEPWPSLGGWTVWAPVKLGTEGGFCWEEGVWMQWALGPGDPVVFPAQKWGQRGATPWSHQPRWLEFSKTESKGWWYGLFGVFWCGLQGIVLSTYNILYSQSFDC